MRGTSEGSSSASSALKQGVEDKHIDTYGRLYHLVRWLRLEPEGCDYQQQQLAAFFQWAAELLKEHDESKREVKDFFTEKAKTELEKLKTADYQLKYMWRLLPYLILINQYLRPKQQIDLRLSALICSIYYVLVDSLPHAVKEAKKENRLNNVDEISREEVRNHLEVANTKRQAIEQELSGALKKIGILEQAFMPNASSQLGQVTAKAKKQDMEKEISQALAKAGVVAEQRHERLTSLSAKISEITPEDKIAAESSQQVPSKLASSISNFRAQWRQMPTGAKVLCGGLFLLAAAGAVVAHFFAPPLLAVTVPLIGKFSFSLSWCAVSAAATTGAGAAALSVYTATQEPGLLLENFQQKNPRLFKAKSPEDDDATDTESVADGFTGRSSLPVSGEIFALERDGVNSGEVRDPNALQQASQGADGQEFFNVPLTPPPEPVTGSSIIKQSPGGLDFSPGEGKNNETTEPEKLNYCAFL